MFPKIVTIVLMAFIAISEGNKVWDGYSAKWAENVADGFYQLPQTLKAARNEGWTEVSGVKASHGVTAVGYCGDPRLVLLFQKSSGKVVGHQVGLLVSDIEKSGVPFDYSANPVITKKTLNGVEYFTATAKYSENKKKGTRQIWLQINGKFKAIPTKSDLVTSKTAYYSKRCIKWMGHHFYQINSTTSVSSLFPWFLLSIGEDIVGIGFQAPGNSSAAPERTWFETIPSSQLLETIPDAPASFSEALASYGLSSLHVWFKKDPTAIVCTDECTASLSTDDQGATKTRKRRATGSGNVC